MFYNQYIPISDIIFVLLRILSSIAMCVLCVLSGRLHVMYTWTITTRITTVNKYTFKSIGFSSPLFVGAHYTDGVLTMQSLLGSCRMCLVSLLTTDSHEHTRYITFVIIETILFCCRIIGYRHDWHFRC